MSRQHFRILLLLSVLSQLAPMVTVFFYPLETSFPQFHDQLSHRYMMDWMMTNKIQAAAYILISILFYLAYVVAIIGLYNFQFWARYVFIVSVLLGMTVILLQPIPFLLTPVQLTASMVSAVIVGAVLYGILTDPLRLEFRGVRKESL